MTTREHPIWKEAATAISERVSHEGYGFMIRMQELYVMLEHDIPENADYCDFKKLEIEKMVKIEGLKRELLLNHNIHLINEYKEGYVVSKPDDQVDKGFNRHFKKARKQMNKGIEVLLNVDEDNLTNSGRECRDRNVNRSLFVIKSMNKRKISMQKLLSNKHK